MSVPVGITVPKLLPITGTFAPLFASYFVLLSARTVAQRINNKTALGDKITATADAASSSSSDSLTVASRSHANFAEHVPLALFLGAVVEMNGGNRRALTGTLAALFVARVLHVEFGLRGERAVGKGRAIGALATQTIIVGFASWGAYLVKGYWGL